MPNNCLIFLLQVHGFPKIMGILTHLDMISKATAVKKAKKELKKRFWTELYKVYNYTLPF